MSFESGRSIGRAATLLIVLGIIAAPVFLFSSFFLRFMFTIPILLIIYIPIVALAFVGNILLIVAMSQFATFYKEPAIFRNTLYGFLTGIIGGIVYVILLFWLFVWATTSIGTYPTNTFAPSSLYRDRSGSRGLARRVLSCFNSEPLLQDSLQRNGGKIRRRQLRNRRATYAFWRRFSDNSDRRTRNFRGLDFCGYGLLLDETSPSAYSS